MSNDSNQIVERQNGADGIKYLRAQRHLYNRAKGIVAAQIILVVGVPLLSVLVGFYAQALRPVTAFIGLLVAGIDVVLLDPWQKALKKKAASIQEEFDCNVMEIPWNEFKVGLKIDPEDIHQASKSHLNGNDDPSLANWYPAEVKELPLFIARIICQRANLRWDGCLRRQYSYWIIGGIMAVLTGALFFSVSANLTMERLVLGVMAPIAPLLQWGVREIYRLREAAAALDALKCKISSLWTRILRKECDSSICEIEARSFQNEIFDRRRSNPLIFNWIYKVLRSTMEDQMTASAREMIKEAKQKVI